MVHWPGEANIDTLHRCAESAPANSLLGGQLVGLDTHVCVRRNICPEEAFPHPALSPPHTGPGLRGRNKGTGSGWFNTDVRYQQSKQWGAAAILREDLNLSREILSHPPPRFDSVQNVKTTFEQKGT